MFSIGLAYITCGIALKIVTRIISIRNNTKLPNRMGNYFLLVGVFNLILSLLKSFFFQEYKYGLELAGLLSVVVFGILCIIEVNRIQKDLNRRFKNITSGEEKEHDLGDK